MLEYTKSPPLQAPHYHKLTFAIPVPVTIRCFYPGKKSLPEDRCGLRTASDPSVSTTAANSTSLILEAQVLLGSALFPTFSKPLTRQTVTMEGGTSNSKNPTAPENFSLPFRASEPWVIIVPHSKTRNPP